MKLLLSLVFIFIIAATSNAETRVALVVHQSEYGEDLSDIPLAKSEADVIASALEDTGFDVTRRSNLSKTELSQALDQFRVKLDRAGPDAVGFLYYTGHGAQNPETRESFLLGTDTKMRVASDFAKFGISLTSQRDELAATGAKAIFMVFDACRNVPNVPEYKASLKGLTRVQAAPEMLIAYSTDLGSLAKAGVYAPILAEEIRRPGQNAALAFFNAQRRVAQQTADTQFPQRPWSDVRLYQDVVFSADRSDSRVEDQSKRPFNDDGSEGRIIQEALVSMKFNPGRTDGTWDVNSRVAASAFQRVRGLSTIDGEPSPQLLSETSSALAEGFSNVACTSQKRLIESQQEKCWQQSVPVEEEEIDKLVYQFPCYYNIAMFCNGFTCNWPQIENMCEARNDAEVYYNFQCNGEVGDIDIRCTCGPTSCGCNSDAECKSIKSTTRQQEVCETTPTFTESITEECVCLAKESCVK
ncbi:MAG: caspase family protein [Pseudomonadota bacterium]